MSELHIWTNDYDWVVAETASDALFVMSENGGYQDLAEYQKDTEDSISNWRQIPDGQYLDMTIEDGGVVKKLASEWAREHGCGWLGGER